MIRHNLVGLLALALLAVAAPAGIEARGSSDAALGYIRLERVLEPSALGVAVPGAISWDANGALLTLIDRASGKAHRFDTLGRPKGSSRVSDSSGDRSLRVSHPGTGHVFELKTRSQQLLEFDVAGRLVASRTLRGLGLASVQGLTFAPSGDPTDRDDETNLYVSASGSGGSASGAGVYELDLSQPLLAASLAGAAELRAALVQTINTTAWSPSSPDPSGLAYVGEDLDRLVAGDGEVEETTGAGFHGVNVWLAQRTGGSAVPALNTLDANPTNREPVGAAYDSVRDELYLSKDGSTSKVWVYQRNGSTFTQVRAFNIYGYGISDAEGLAFGNNTLYVADGLGKEVWRIAAGSDSVVGTGGDDVVSHFDVESLGSLDPEGIGFHPLTGNLWLASRHRGDGLLEVTTSGTPVSHATFDFSPISPSGIDLAPSSTDATRINIWMSDRGVDNGANSNENDGRLYELTLGDAPPPPPPGANLLLNAGFEAASLSGQPSDWSTDSRFTRSNTQVHGELFAGRHQAVDNSRYTIRQDVPITAGQTYSFNGWANAPATTDSFELRFEIQWRTSRGKLSTTTIGSVTSSTSGWIELSGSGTAPAGAITARVTMVAKSLNTTIYVDDLAFAAT
jgi:hypothetical protein